MARPLGTDGLKDGRGAAVADLDGNGGLDLVINNNAGTPTVYLNRVPNAGHWLALDLEGTFTNRNAVGARVVLEAGGRQQVRQVEAGSGYASQHPTTVHFGLGRAQTVDRLRITWPDGQVEELQGPDAAALGIDRRVHIVQGAEHTTARQTKSRSPETTGRS